MTIFLGQYEGQIFTRESKSKVYEYVVICRAPQRPVAGRDNELWTAENWCGRLDLARAKCKGLQKIYHEVRIVPVFEKTKEEAKQIKEDLAEAARLQAEALQIFEASEAARAAEEAAREAEEAARMQAAEEAARQALTDEIQAAKYRIAKAELEAAEAEAARLAQEREEADAAMFIALALQTEAEDRDAQEVAALAHYREEAQDDPEEITGQPEKFGPVPYAPSKICKRCGKVLTGPESVARGYGDKCWRRVWRYIRGGYEPVQAQYHDKQSIINPATALHARLEIDRRVCNSYEKCLCGAHAADGELFTYDHEAGYRLPGYENPQWVFTKCQKCGHENSLRKMPSVDLEDLETEGRREAGIRLAEEEAAKAAKQAQAVTE